MITDRVLVNTSLRAATRVDSDTCPHSARMCMQASCLNPLQDYESWLGDYEVALSDAPHIAKYFNEMAKQQDQALEKSMKSTKDYTNMHDWTDDELEKASATTRDKWKRHKEAMMDRLKVHARDLFNHHDKNDNGVLDKEESKVRQYCMHLQSTRGCMRCMIPPLDMRVRRRAASLQKLHSEVYGISEEARHEDGQDRSGL